ncbi:caspase, EACC1-associated type [Streptomyces aurantiacus]|uniref:caspase, EACC1-associated type n=1 Tax=Streptomyces aurantiacus TaxID=47760 RepID=UPI0006E307E8|nr:caspase family protein [Streptomyces aurantiacus]
MTLPDPAASRAVLIGVDKYAVLDRLPAVTKNLRGMEELLIGPGSWGLDPKHCVVLCDPESPVTVFDAVHAAGKEATDALFVYFAGHGLPSPQLSLFLGLPNSHLGRLYDSVDYDQLRSLIQECPARRRVVVLDCCYGGMAMHGRMGLELPLADLTCIEGTYLMTASAAEKTAMAPEGENYTAFTGELLKAAAEGVPDGPELLDMGALFTHVRRELRAKGRPVPQQWAGELGQHIALSRNRWTPVPGPEAKAYATALREAAARAGGDVEQLLGDPSLVRRYLRGQSVAPREFVVALSAHGVVLPQAALTRLHTLRRTAQRTAPDTRTQILYWQEEVELLGSRLAQAGDYSHTIEGELTAARKRLRQLDTEVRVLQGQVERLREEKPTRAEAVVEAAVAVSVGEPRSRHRQGGPAGPGSPAVETGTGPKPGRSMGCGGASALLAALALVYLTIVGIDSAGSVTLVYDSGRRPALVGGAVVSNDGPDGPQHMWDVVGSVESVFRPDGDAAVDRLLGGLTVSVPKGCADRTVHWRITVDGESVDEGSLTGKREHRVTVDLAQRGVPGKVGFGAWWDGGGSCESFGLVLGSPRLSKSFDLIAW